MTPDVAMAAPAYPGRRPGAAVPDAGMDDDGKVLEASVRDPDRSR